MKAVWSRDFPTVTRESLLDDYVARAKGNYSALAATALRTRSLGTRDILAHAALRSSSSTETLKEQLLKSKRIQTDDVADVRALAELGRVVLLQNLLPNDIEFGELLLSTASELDTKGRVPAACRLVLAQLYISQKKHNRARQLLDAWSDIDKKDFGYLRAEMLNPFTNNRLKDIEAWLEAFNEPFLHYGLTPVSLNDDKSLLPFDRLQSAGTLSYVGPKGPLVSVILTVFRPEEERLLTSVRSILHQTWRNLELIIVDDCSGPEFKSIFDRLDKLDTRIMIIHASVNRGTYVARNIGYSAANGQLITGQDDDDWSHPERLERQVTYLKSNQNAIGCRVDAVRCENNLQRVRVGYSPKGQNASSLMIRREAYELAGDFLPARKAADTEYHLRIERITGRPIATIREPLSVIRILQSSLSRGDFGPEWKHASRISFRSAYEHWHRTNKIEDLQVGEGRAPEVKIPCRFAIGPREPSRSQLDVVVAANWEDSGEYLEILLEEVRALVASGYRVGIINLESPLKFRKRIQVSLDGGIQSLLNKGTVEEIFLDDEVDIRLLIVRHVPVLQFRTATPSSLNVGSLAIGADIPPATSDGNNIAYRVQDCMINAVTTFGREPLWIPWSTGVRESLSKCLDSSHIADFNFPQVIRPDRWSYNRLWYRSVVPLVGYYATGQPIKVSGVAEHFEELQRCADKYDIREWRTISLPSTHENREGEVIGSLRYCPREMAFPDFLDSIDYIVFGSDPQFPGVEFEIAVRQALESGIAVILPEIYKSVYGDAATYAGPGKINETIAELHSDFEYYQSHLAQAFMTITSRFSRDSFASSIARILTEQRV